MIMDGWTISPTSHFDQIWREKDGKMRRKHREKTTTTESSCVWATWMSESCGTRIEIESSALSLSFFGCESRGCLDPNLACACVLRYANFKILFYSRTTWRSALLFWSPLKIVLLHRGDDRHRTWATHTFLRLFQIFKIRLFLPLHSHSSLHSCICTGCWSIESSAKNTSTRILENASAYTTWALFFDSIWAFIPCFLLSITS